MIHTKNTGQFLFVGFKILFYSKHWWRFYLKKELPVEHYRFNVSNLNLREKIPNKLSLLSFVCSGHFYDFSGLSKCEIFEIIIA